MHSKREVFGLRSSITKPHESRGTKFDRRANLFHSSTDFSQSEKAKSFDTMNTGYRFPFRAVFLAASCLLTDSSLCADKPVTDQVMILVNRFP